MLARRSFSFDWVLILLTLMLLGLGLLMIASATTNAAKSDVPFNELPAVRQGINAAISLVALIAATLINYRAWSNWRWLLYGITLVVLIAVLTVGLVMGGAQSWFQILDFALQPSELAKITLIIVLARYLADHEYELKQGSGLIASLLLVLPLLVLVGLQPDLGTALVIATIWLGMVFLAGARLQHLLILALIVLVCIPLLWGLMSPDMRVHAGGRIQTFLHPADDPLGAGYNPRQCLIAVGSGGFWGKGLGQGTQSQLAFLRVRHTDFIFSVLAEELGLVGSLLLLVLLAGLLLRIIGASARAGDAYGRLLANGVAIMIFIQVAINVGFNVGLFPVTGLTLPLISYGGSSLIATFIGLGLVESINIHPLSPGIMSFFD